MKVLLLHHHFNTPDTGGPLRSYYLARALAEAGMEVSVITCFNGKQYAVENVEGIRVHYLPIEYHNRFGFYKRSYTFVRYIWGVMRMGRQFRNTDVCYAISVPLTVGIPAMLLKWRYKIPFIFEVGDLWPEAPVQMGFVKNAVLKKMLYALERKIYGAARSIVALSPAIASTIRNVVPEKKIDQVPNMGDTEFFKPRLKDPVLQHRLKVENKFVVSYIGAVGLANGLEFFLACAHACDRAGLPVQFLLCGEGARLDALRQRATELALSNFSFLPFCNREGVREIMQVTDATFICYEPVPVLETGSPNKYFDGLAAGKLIVVNFSGWIREEIEHAGCGIYISPAAPESFVEKIRPLLYSEKLLKQYQQAARRLAENKYSRKLLSAKFVSIFTNDAAR